MGGRVSIHCERPGIIMEKINKKRRALLLFVSVMRDSGKNIIQWRY